MTEKKYGGSDGISRGGISSNAKSEKKKGVEKKENKEEDYENTGIIGNKEIEKLKKAGEISKKVKELAREIIKPGVSLFEIAEKLEAKMIELGGKPAFPTNLSINEIAAHSTPMFNDETKAHGLLKIDVGVHVDGFVADTAFSVDLENSEENKKLIESAELAVRKGVETISLKSKLMEIGAAIESSIKFFGFQPIINLSGHSIEQYNLHSGVTIPNYNNSQEYVLEEGVYAIEPFATSGVGRVKDGKPSGIYRIDREGNVRDAFAREVLDYIIKEYGTLPFCSRWLVKKFGSRALIAMKRIEEAGIVHQYAQLIEESKRKVAQAEHTVILTGNEKIVTT